MQDFMGGLSQDPEAALSARVAETRERYRKCCATGAQSELLRQDLGPAHPDSLVAQRKSLRDFNAALKEYKTALREWRDFVISGNIPAWLAEPGSVQESESGPGAAVLIVDDDPVFARSLSHLLSTSGYNILVANNGEAAVEILEQDCSIRVVICDLVLPSMSGFEVIGALTRHGSCKIIAASGVFRNPLLEAVSRQLGADAFVEKPAAGDPFAADVWLRAVRDVLAP